MGHPLTSSFKSIEACAGKVSVHRMACHFNSLHFLEQAPGEPEQDALVCPQGNRLSIFRPLRGRKYAENLLRSMERMERVDCGCLALPPVNPRQALSRFDGT